MHTLSLGLSYIVQDRKFERHKFSSKHQSCMCGCDVFPAVQAGFIAGHVRYLVNAMLGIPELLRGPCSPGGAVPTLLRLRLGSSRLQAHGVIL